MNYHRLSALAAGLFLSVSTGALTAQAADVTAHDPWSGFYLGAQAGYILGNYSDSRLCDSIKGMGSYCATKVGDGVSLDDAKPDGATVGGYAGFNYRIDRVVLGLEGELNWDNGEDSTSIADEVNVESSLNWDAAIRARLGMVVGERALLYVTGGPSWLNTELDTGYHFKNDHHLDLDVGDSSTEFGWVLGAGAEYALTDHLSVKAEYLHGWYGDADLDLVSVTDGRRTETYTVRQDLQTNVVRAGIAYHFGSF